MDHLSALTLAFAIVEGPRDILSRDNLSELSNYDTSSPLEEADSQLSRIRDVTPETSVSQRVKEGVFKKPKKGVGLLNYISEWSHRPQVSI
jgi:hypothetical protein